MTLPEKIFALRRLPVLADLSESELAVLAEAALERRYAPGVAVLPAGRPPRQIPFVCGGAVLDAAGRDQGCTPGAAALLSDQSLPGALHAAAVSGALCLVVARSHVFTVVRQCPAFVVALLGDHGTPAP